MNAGNLDELITIQRATQAKNSATGEVTNTWSTLEDAWAQVKPSESGSQINAGMQQQFKQRVVFKIRYTSNPTINDRILLDGETYHIIAITDIDRRMYLIVDAEKTATNEEPQGGTFSTTQWQLISDQWQNITDTWN